MAQVTPGQDDIKALEQTRQRLSQLKSNIISLQQDVARSSTLPQWASLQTSTSILVNNIQTLTAHLSKHSEQLNRTVVYPSTNYPGRTQEPLLTQLLRKKPEPAVETWVDEGRTINADLDGSGIRGGEEELWGWARTWLDPRIQKFAIKESSDNYTAEERAMGIENVRTGLRRKLEDNHHDSDEEEDEDEDEDEDEEMEDAAPGGMPAGTREAEFGMGEVTRDPVWKTRSEADILRFAITGNVVESGPGIRR